MEDLDGKEIPTFTLKEFSFVGLLEVSFSQQMIPPWNLTEIDDSVFELAVVLDESNDIADDLSKVAFTWSVVSYEKTNMNL